MKIYYSSQARADLREICDYIEFKLYNPTASHHIAEQIIKSSHTLIEHPMLGISLNAKTGRETDYRCLVSGNYGIIYRADADSDTVIIIRILDLRTDYMKAIFDE